MKRIGVYLWIFLLSSLSEAAGQTDISVNDSLCDPLSFYFLSDLPLREVGTLILKDSIEPLDNMVTFNCMDSVADTNSETRDYYFPIFIKIIEQADGALAEVTGSFVVQYIEQYPAEFASRCPQLSTDQFKKLAAFAAYELYFSDDNDIFVFDWENTLINSCKNCSAVQKDWIYKFNQEFHERVLELNGQ